MAERLCSIFVAAAALLSCALVQPAFAQESEGEAPAAGLSIQSCEGVNLSHESEDRNAVEAAISDFYRGGYGALRAHLRALSVVMDHAPPCYPAIERREGQILVHTYNPQHFLMVSVILSAAPDAGGLAPILQTDNIYPMASMLLASYANETGRFEEALTWIDRGLALQPQNEMLLSEKGAAYAALARPQDAADTFKFALDNPEFFESDNRPRLLRGLGISLIDLNRLDEAEAALNEVLELEPGNPTATNEIAYIAELRHGATPRRAVELTNPNPPPTQSKPDNY